MTGYLNESQLEIATVIYLRDLGYNYGLPLKTNLFLLRIIS